MPSKRQPRRRSLSPAKLDEMIEEATVDAYGESRTPDIEACENVRFFPQEIHFALQSCPGDAPLAKKADRFGSHPPRLNNLQYPKKYQELEGLCQEFWTPT